MGIIKHKFQSMFTPYQTNHLVHSSAAVKLIFSKESIVIHLTKDTVQKSLSSTVPIQHDIAVFLTEGILGLSVSMFIQVFLQHFWQIFALTQITFGLRHKVCQLAKISLFMHWFQMYLTRLYLSTGQTLLISASHGLTNWN